MTVQHQHSQSYYSTIQLVLAMYSIGISLWCITLVADQSKLYYQQQVDTLFIDAELTKIVYDDLNNPSCNTWLDDTGALHGCLTDVQLEAVDTINTYLHE